MDEKLLKAAGKQTSDKLKNMLIIFKELAVDKKIAKDIINKKLLFEEIFMKVYCSNCIHLDVDETGTYQCEYSYNVKKEKEFNGDWLNPPAYKKIYAKKPSEINKNNNCPWYCDYDKDIVETIG